ncbi:reprolysin-like metallopeptidase [Chryseobacterium oryctis]|uniref:M12 family metallo-peptidase n=1 Tax=Chryseobacterium oryctis TaxID=2952618 RepID=A0ABT3HM56_9FLAO|nr:zinc-dependent metalloprotease family protein [Chryseobacterium oryctis]MCW3160877.1 M12 family metallo-peptidase [Chryseobacterium oryctis]
MKKRILLICALAGFVTSAYAQRWEPVSQKVSQIRKEVEVQYAYRVDLASIRNLLKDAVETGNGAKPVIISLPTVEGKIEKFAVYSNPVMEKSLADRYQLGSYVGVGVDDPSKYVRFSTSPTELQSMIIKDGVFQFIEPISTDKQTYGVFYKTKRNKSEHGFECTTEERTIEDIKKLELNGKKKLSNVGITNRPSSTKYRTYRLALSATGEYTQAAGGTVAAAVTRMNNTMTRVNGVFEKDFGIKLLVQDIPAIIYTDAATDPYTNNLNLQLQQTLTSVVGNDNYDIGHVFNAAGGNGNAGGIGVICTNPATNNSLAKGSAFTQNTNPTGDLFDIDYVAHEMGHQLGANHTFSNRTEGSGVNVEPGGGTTIMGYAGITYDNVQMNSDAYFHYSSIDQVLTTLDGKTGCGTSADITTNTPPTIATLGAYSIPKGTAYYLETTATDAQNDPLKYTWEQYDSVDGYASISGDSGWGYNTQGTLTRSRFGTSSGRRYFPSLALVMNGILTNKTNPANSVNTDWETVSYVPRTLKYAVTVRDENPTRPMLSSSETTVTVGEDGPFKFNGLTNSSILYKDATNIIQWEVANTTAAPYNVANVKIDYTTDNGATWTDLVASTPNNGSYSAQMPSSLSGTIKLRISAIGNVFYAVSPAVTIGSAPTSTSAAPTGVSTIASEILKTSARVSWNSVPGATYSINYRKAGTTNWTNTTSAVNSVLINGLEDESSYEVQVAAVVNNVPGAFSSNYTFKTNSLKTGVDYCILNSGVPDIGAISSVKVSNIDYTDNTIKAYKDLSEDASKIINLVQGNSYTLTPKVIQGYLSGGAPLNVSVWIDYNRNGVFETSERVISVSGTAPYGIVSFGAQNFTVPTTTYAGDKLLRMRVVAKYNTAALASTCGFISSGGGSVMDLPVKITSNSLSTNETTPSKSEISLYPNPADTFVEIKNLKGSADYKIYSADGRLVLNGKTEGRIDVQSLVKGVYVITIVNGEKTLSTKLIKK